MAQSQGTTATIGRPAFGRHGVRETALEILAEAAQGDFADGKTTIGTRTLADLRHSAPEPPLVAPFLAAEGVTVLYGPGGVGKGMLCVYFAKRLIEHGLSVMILDFEDHETEWGHRSRALGFTDEQLAQAHYRAPFSAEWTAAKGSLAEVAEFVAEDCARLKVSYLIIDSYSASTSSGDNMGGKEAADEFYQAIRVIGLPAAVIAHVKGSSQSFPDRPFGSVYVHNYARATWAVETASEPAEIQFDAATNDLQPTVMALELRHKKMNSAQLAPPQFVTFSFFDGHIEVDEQAPQKHKSYSDLVADVLRRATKPMTLQDLAKTIRANHDTLIKSDTLEKTLRRHPDRFTRVESTPYSWKLAEQAEPAVRSSVRSAPSGSEQDRTPDRTRLET